jgi:hypothetical protein
MASKQRIPDAGTPGSDPTTWHFTLAPAFFSIAPAGRTIVYVLKVEIPSGHF